MEDLLAMMKSQDCQDTGVCDYFCVEEWGKERTSNNTLVIGT